MAYDYNNHRPKFTKPKTYADYLRSSGYPEWMIKQVKHKCYGRVDGPTIAKVKEVADGDK